MTRQRLDKNPGDIVDLFHRSPTAKSVRKRMPLIDAIRTFILLPDADQRISSIVVGVPELQKINGREVWLNVIPYEGVMDLIDRGYLVQQGPANDSF